MNLTFSVIIPLYNKDRFIGETISHALAQTYSAFEIIVVDDGSTDDGLTIIRSFMDPRIIIITQTNQGVAAARNKGIQHASGQYIAFLDADDLWESKYLEHMLYLITKYPEAALYGSSYSKYKDQQIFPRKQLFQSEFEGYVYDFFKKSLNHFMFWTSATVVKAEAFNTIGFFDERMKLGDDSDMWIRLALHGKVVFSTKVFAYYRLDDQQSIIHSKYALKDQFLGYPEKYATWEKKHADFNKFINLTRFNHLAAIILNPSNHQKEVKSFIRNINTEHLTIQKKLFLKLPLWMIKFIFSLR